jgi:uncharacterized protein (DUF58 family)
MAIPEPPRSAGAGFQSGLKQSADTTLSRSDQVEHVLRRLELTITRRLDGLLHGSYLGLLPGAGTEPGESREYHPGDDVRRMDWPVTARTQVPYVRQTEADRELETWIVYDASNSLAFGTALYEKRDLALAGLAAIVFLAVGGGNRIGAMIAGGTRLMRVPAQSGMAAARGLIRTAMTFPAAEQGQAPVTVGAAIDALRRVHRRRGLAVVISDFLGDPSWEEPLRGLGALQQVLAIDLVDQRDLDLPAVGLLRLVDPETGEELELQTSRREVRERYAAAARAQRERIEAGVRRARASHLQLRTDRDWLIDIVRFVGEQKRRRMK